MKTYLNVMRASARTCINVIHVDARTYTYIYVLCLLLMGTAQAAQSQFFETLYDVPIMHGMEELPDRAISFDKANGRISEAGAVAPGYSEDAVMDFYKTALFQMGWLYEGGEKHDYRFTREEEELVISFVKSETSPYIRFILRPYQKVRH